MAKRALITGITGQDGAYLAQFLLDHGYEVFGMYRRLSTPNFWRLYYLNIFEKISLIRADLLDSSSLYHVVKTINPDEIYNLAAQSFVSQSFEQPIADFQITGLGVAKILEVIRMINPKIKFYQASTSELYGNQAESWQSEDSPFKPSSPYAASKLYGYWITRYFREHYNLFSCNGILFNHESPIRGLEFVTRKISNEVAKIKAGISNQLKLGNLTAQRDWGYAPEYVAVMWLLLQQDTPEDYVISTGETHSVQDFVEKAFDIVGLNWNNYVVTDDKLQRPIDVNYLLGDNTKAKTRLGWEPKIKFDKLVDIMVTEDVNRWQRWKKGEYFHWDALNYESEKNIIAGKDKL